MDKFKIRADFARAERVIAKLIAECEHKEFRLDAMMGEVCQGCGLTRKGVEDLRAIQSRR